MHNSSLESQKYPDGSFRFRLKKPYRFLVINKKSFYRLIISMTLGGLLGAASLSLLGAASRPLSSTVVKLRYGLVACCLGTFLILGRFRISPHISKQSLGTFGAWLLFGISVLFSALLNADTSLLIDGLWFVLAVPLIFFNVFPNLVPRISPRQLVTMLFFSQAVYIIVSLLVEPPLSITSRYGGVFPNTNQFGGVCVVLGACSLVMWVSSIAQRNSLWAKLAISLLVIGCLFLTAISFSRTSLVTFFILILVIAVASIRSWKLFRKICMYLALLGCMVFVAYLNPQIQDLTTGIMNKLESKLQEGDILSGRQAIWTKTLREFSVFGHGSRYFADEVGSGAHNSLIKVLGENGIFAMVSLMAFGILGFLQSILYFKKYFRTDPYAITPLILAVCFWIMSMGEGLFGSIGRGITVAYMISIGMVMASHKESVANLVQKAMPK
ncbi:MAG: O-antigen ligase family protein [Anaerolineae bacterium]|nr:O-antigen ligase family protein [Anaerolineae bacterium]